MEAFDESGGLNSIAMRRHNYWIFIVTPVSLLAVVLGWPQTQGIHIFLFISLFILSGLGVTVGYHRYFVHHGFKCKPWFAYVLMIVGTLTASGPLLPWVRSHLRHLMLFIF